MLPAPTQLIECPTCKSLMKKPGWLSGNTFGAKIYSDGKKVAEMLPNFPQITKCKKCNNIFWVKDAKVIGEFEWGNKISQEWEAAPELGFLSIEDYHSALNSDLSIDKNHELYFRKNIWWSFNDRQRNDLPFFNNDEERQLWFENLKKLCELLDENNTEQQIMKAEVYRNLGRFDDCKIIINSISIPELEWIKEKYIKACDEQNQNVIQLN